MKHHKSPKHEERSPMTRSKGENRGHEGKMTHAGYAQGDMSPHVEDYQKPEKDFAERGFNKTIEYVERQDRMQSGMAKGLDKQAYQGRYS